MDTIYDHFRREYLLTFVFLSDNLASTRHLVKVNLMMKSGSSYGLKISTSSQKMTEKRAALAANL